MASTTLSNDDLAVIFDAAATHAGQSKSVGVPLSVGLWLDGKLAKRRSLRSSFEVRRLAESVREAGLAPLPSDIASLADCDVLFGVSSPEPERESRPLRAGSPSGER